MATENELRTEAVNLFRAENPEGSPVFFQHLSKNRVAFFVVGSDRLIYRVDRIVARILGRQTLPENGRGVAFKGHNYNHAAEAVAELGHKVWGDPRAFRAVEL